MISLVLPATACCARTRPHCWATALSRCWPGMPAGALPRRVLPSSAMPCQAGGGSAGAAGAAACSAARTVVAQWVKAASKAVMSRAAKTRLRVDWEGPRGWVKPRRVRRAGSQSAIQSARSLWEEQPHRTAAQATVSRAAREWRRPRAWRQSGKSARMGATGGSAMSTVVSFTKGRVRESYCKADRCSLLGLDNE